MPKKEAPRRLLKQLAEAYAFILDVRRLAIERADGLLLKKTRGIEEKVEELRKQYPRRFKRYLTNADKKAKAIHSGQRKAVPRRKKAPQEKEKES